MTSATSPTTCAARAQRRPATRGGRVPKACARRCCTTSESSSPPSGPPRKRGRLLEGRSRDERHTERDRRRACEPRSDGTDRAIGGGRDDLARDAKVQAAL